MKTLLIDIETSPNLAHVWSLWNNNVSLAQLRESSYMLCFAAKWYREDGVFFARRYGDDARVMHALLFNLLNEADALITYNGDKFDIPICNQELMLAGYLPPSPFKSIDLCKTAKRQFRFVSNKLEYVSRKLGLEGKVQHTGHQLWVDCLAEKKEAWQDMEKYNVQDVLLLEPMYERLLPWIPGHPNVLLYGVDTERLCVKCGSRSVQSRGYVQLLSGSYRQYRCNDCGGWSRGTKRIESVDYVGVKR